MKLLTTGEITNTPLTTKIPYYATSLAIGHIERKCPESPGQPAVHKPGKWLRILWSGRY